MAYKVLEVVALPDPETGGSTRKEPGDTITEAEFKKAGQDEDAIKALVKDGAIEKGEK